MVTMATNYQHSVPKYDDNNIADQSPLDPLDLNDYVMPDLQNQRIETLSQASQSPPVGVGTRPTLMSTFSDFPTNFQNGSRDFPAFNTTFDRIQLASPTIKSNSYNPHRGSISTLSEGHNSTASAPQHRLSIGSTGDVNQQRDGLDNNNTSPESGQGLGVLGTGHVLGDGSTISIKVDESMNEDGAEGSITSRKDDKGEAPPWSEMKTKAGKERKRLPLACIVCRRKKIRCSGEKPACKHCLRSRIPCVYKVTTRKAAPRTDYMAMLDKRLKRMEDRVIKLIPKENLGSVSVLGRSVVKPALPGPPAKAANSKKRAADEAFGGDLDDWSKSKSANPNEGNSAAAKARDAEESRLLTEGAESLPSKEMQEHLAEVYFDYVYGQSYPLLHKPSFMRRLAAGSVPPVLILAICAISARFSTHPQLRSEPAFLRGENLAEKAREISLKRYDTPNITILIVYLLLGLHEFGTCQGGRSWMFGGMAQRMAYALQLHKDLDYDPAGGEKGERKQLSFIDREIRRRTMWSCFLMDRFNSSGTDRPMFVDEQYIQAQLPIKEQFFINEIHGTTENLDGDVINPLPSESAPPSDPKHNMGVAAYLIRLVAIWGLLIKYMNLGGQERESVPMWSPKSTYYDIKSRIQQFQESLPACLRYSEENLKINAIEKTANQFLYLHILYQQVVLFMNRFSLPSTAGSRPPEDMPRQFLSEAARTAFDAANQISILINESMDYNVVAPFAGYSAFFSSTVHVHGVFSKNPKLEAQSKKYLAYNIRYLSKMKKYWGMFHFIAENLKELYRQHADAVLQGPAAASAKGAQSGIFQYGDWFDRYPHGVSNTDYEDPAVDHKKELGTDAVLGQKSDLQSVEEFFATLSPPSRTEQHRKVMKKSKQTKASLKHESTTNTATDATNNTHSDSQSQAAQMLLQQTQQHQMKYMPIARDANADSNAIETATFDPAYFGPGSSHSQSQSQPQPQSQQQPSFHPSFPPHTHAQHAQHDLSLTSPSASLIPQIDLSSFPDLSAGAPANGLWNMDLGGMGSGMFSDPSTAWFLPFNVEPPLLGEDGGFGLGGYDGGLGFGWGEGGTDVDGRGFGDGENGGGGGVEAMANVSAQARGQGRGEGQGIKRGLGGGGGVGGTVRME